MWIEFSLHLVFTRQSMIKVLSKHFCYYSQDEDTWRGVEMIVDWLVKLNQTKHYLCLTLAELHGHLGIYQFYSYMYDEDPFP